MPNASGWKELESAAREQAQAGIGQLLTAREVCGRLRIGRSTFYTLAFFKRRAVRIGRVVRYKLTDVIAFEHEHQEAA